MAFKTPFTFLIGLSAMGLSAAALLYFFYSKDDGLIRKGRKSGKKCKLQLAVPREHVSAVIGREGSKVKEIEGMTSTRIYFEDGNETLDHRICVIRGTSEGAQLAKCLLESIVKNQPIVENYEMLVPSHAGGRIIGRSGNTIRSIARASSAKLMVGKSDEFAEGLIKIRITGTAEQIELAKLLVEEKVMEEQEMRRRIQEGIQRRSPRRTSSNASTTSEQELTDEREGFLKVYISAVQHPGRFWMQVFGPRTVDLDQLIEQMTEFYSKEENRQLHIITEPYMDQMVAAPFGDDNKWYRGKITGIHPIDDAVNIIIYYVDYGDSTELSKGQVFSLRSDFLMVRHQAIECTLAHVKPKNSFWSKEATETFDELCHCAQWRTVMAKINSYMECERGEREGSPIPVVELYGNDGSREISIGKELVKRGFAEDQHAGSDSI